MSLWRGQESLKMLLGAALGIGIGATAVMLLRRHRAIRLPHEPRTPPATASSTPTKSVTSGAWVPDTPMTSSTGSTSPGKLTAAASAIATEPRAPTAAITSMPTPTGQPVPAATSPAGGEAQEPGGDTANLEEQSLLAGGPRVKFSAHWLGTLDEFFSKHPELRRPYEDVCAALSDRMEELENLGVTPIIPADGKVGGNCSALVQGEVTWRVVVSRSGKAAHKRMEADSDYVIIEDFDRDGWSCDYYARDAAVLPTSDAPLHWTILCEARRDMAWEEHPAVVLHGHAFETEEAAQRYGYPISVEETLFSTKEDTDALVELMKSFPYPKHNIYIRKGHGFVLLARDTQNARDIFEIRMKPFLPVEN